MSYGPPNDSNQQPAAAPGAGQQPGYQEPPAAYSQPSDTQSPGYLPYGQQPPAAYQQPGTSTPPANQFVAGFQRFSLGRKLALSAAGFSALMFFLPWYSVRVALLSDSVNGIRGFGALGFILTLAVIFVTGLPLLGRRLRDIIPVTYPDGMLVFFGSCAAFVLTLLTALTIAGSSSWDSGIGMWLGLLGLAAMAGGGWLMYQARE